LTDLLARYGWDDRWQQRYLDWSMQPGSEDIPAPEPGRVVRHDGAGLIVATEGGPVRAMFGPAVDPAPVVGDWVVVDATPHPVATLPRASLLRRRAAGGEREQPLVANVDVVLAVCGLDRPVRKGRIQRTLAIAIDAGAETLVVLTKADKVDPVTAALAEELVHEVDPSLQVVTLSAKGGWGIDDLLTHVGQRTLALIGESGAGKSTLVNAMMSSDVAAEGDVREGDAKGRHTTSHRELHVLEGGGILVDTPGIREVGTWTDPDAVAETFPDIEELAEGCRFRNCAHDAEPGCAVHAAVDDGDLAADRFERWRSLEAEAAATEARADVVEQRRRSRQFGRMVRDVQKAKDDLRGTPDGDRRA
jgi:ribosome biogenesis GTPase